MTVLNWADLTTDDFGRLDGGRAIAVLPLGATEQHGPHLPLSTDTDLATGVIRRAAGLVDPSLSVLILPPMPFGRSAEHEDFPGTISLSAQTMIQILMEIGAGVADAGVDRLVLFNGHGGNVSVMDIVARDLRHQTGLWVAHTSWFSLCDAADHLDGDELTHGIHGGALETSAMLALDDDRVRMDLAKDFPSKGREWAKRFREVGVGGKPVKLGWMMRDLNPDGAAGNAAAATPEVGVALVTRAAERFAAFLSEFATMETPER